VRNSPRFIHSIALSNSLSPILPAGSAIPLISMRCRELTDALAQRCVRLPPSPSQLFDDFRHNAVPVSGHGCLNSLALGYQGLSSRSSNQRQSGTYCRRTHTGRPSAPARWTGAVSDENGVKRHGRLCAETLG
jgi:hypothetical protein